MKDLVRFGGMGLPVLGIAILATSIQAAERIRAEDQVAVLMKWYHIYFDEGKYKQAEQVAQLAYELAPDDPQITVALKLARRQQANSSPPAVAEAQLSRVLQRLERVERQLRTTAAKNRQRAILQIAQEPPGSPDGNR